MTKKHVISNKYMTIVFSMLTFGIAFTITTPIADANHLTCDGSTTTIDGTNNSETKNGTTGADVIQLLDGDDISDGFEANDKICGGNGRDDIKGNSGNDRLRVLVALHMQIQSSVVLPS